MKKVEEVVGAVLKIPPKKITDDTSPENTTSWDSFNGLLLATELEKEYKITFSIEEVVAVRRVADIKKALRSRGVPV